MVIQYLCYIQGGVQTYDYTDIPFFICRSHGIFEARRADPYPV